MPRSEREALRKEVEELRAALSRDLLSQLRVRGFRVHSMQPGGDLLIPAPEHTGEFYDLMKKYSFRLFLREVIKRQGAFGRRDVTRYANARVTGEYIDALLDMGLARREGRHGFRLLREVSSFGDTLEWFMAEVMKREFLTQAFWGVKFKGKQVGGDYDLLARVDCSLLYMEVKSSPPKQVQDAEVAAFLDRVEDLAPLLSVFFMDTELRMKDKIVSMFEEELARRSPGEPPPVLRMEKELFRAGEDIFIINAKDSIVANLEKVLSWRLRRKT
jgi:hypothetical protein